MDQVHVVRHKVLVEGRIAAGGGAGAGAVADDGRGSIWTRRRRSRKRRPAPRPRPVWDAVGARVEALLAESAQWTGGKQRLTATRLHELLRGRGPRVGVTVVKDAVAEWKRQRREVFVPLTYRPGDLAEVDFFEVLVDVDGDAPEGVALPDAADVLGPRLRLDLRAAGSNQLSRRARPRLRALRRRAGARRLRQSARRGRPDPGRRRAHADAAVRGARLALSARGVLLSARRGPRQGRRRGARQGHAAAGAGADSESAPTLAAINATLLAQMDARLDDHAGCGRARRSARASPRSSALFRPVAAAVCARGHDARHGDAARAGPARGRVVLGAGRAGRASTWWCGSARRP